MLTKSLVYEMSAMAMRWRLASSSVLNVDSMPWPPSAPARSSHRRRAAGGLRPTSRSATASSVTSSLTSWVSVVASATTECHLGVDGSRSREFYVHHNIRTPYTVMRGVPKELESGRARTNHGCGSDAGRHRVNVKLCVKTI